MGFRVRTYFGLIIVGRESWNGGWGRQSQTSERWIQVNRVLISRWVYKARNEKKTKAVS